ncbi:MAG: S8 family serine peptidase [Spirochaetes bacterium]|nr:S8 family serine peptidase [Spirochaetota bacterium]
MLQRPRYGRFGGLVIALAILSSCTQIATIFDFRPPAELGEVEAVGLDGAVRLAWLDSPDDDFVYAEITWNGGGLATAPNGDETYTVEGLTNGSQYAFLIRAVDRAGNASEGVPVNATPTAGTPYTLLVSWDSFQQEAAISKGTAPGAFDRGVFPVASSSEVDETGRASKSLTTGGSRTRSFLSSRREPPDRVIVKYRDSEDSGASPGGVGTVGPAGGADSGSDGRGVARARIQSMGSEKVLASPRGARISRISPDPAAGKTVDEIIDYYNSLPEVEYAERDKWVYAFAEPNDPGFGNQWNFAPEHLDMASVWEQWAGSAEIVVAVIDSGVYEGLTDFGGTSFVAGTNTIDGYDAGNTDDDNGHGSHVAGTVAQSTDNGEGVAGMAYGVTIMPVKALAQDGFGTGSDIVEGVYWAADNGADVINLSLGGGPYSQSEEDAVRYAYEHGVVVIAASGNTNGAVSYPAAHDDWVLAVGATRIDGQRAVYSNFGPELDVAAPGGQLYDEATGELMDLDPNPDYEYEGILQQTFNGYDPLLTPPQQSINYYFFEGTSMAAPHVSALAALLFSQDPNRSAGDIYSIIRTAVDDLGDPGHDHYYGHGLINPWKALATTIYSLSGSVEDTIHVAEDGADYWDVSATGGSFAIDLSFVHADVDLQLALLDSNGEKLAVAQTSADTESIVFDAGGVPGTYTIEVSVGD